MNPIYLAFKQGIYRHELIASGLDLEQVKKEAESAMRNDRDTYHSTEVIVTKDWPVEEPVGTLQWDRGVGGENPRFDLRFRKYDGRPDRDFELSKTLPIVWTPHV